MKALFIFRKDFRYIDNTCLNVLAEDNNINEILPIFNFDPKQIEEKNNKYFNNNAVEFMCESLLSLEPKPFFTNDYIINTINNLYKKWNFDIIGFNKDYTPFSIKRDNEIKNWCENNNVKLITTDDILLMPYNIIKNTTKEKYQKFTPFYKKCLENKKYIIKFKDNSKKIIDKINLNKLKKIDFDFLNDESIHKFYVKNLNITIFYKDAYKKMDYKHIKEYKTIRDYPEIATSNLSTYLKFGIISIREIYNNFIKYPDFIRQLYWREFYYNLGLYTEENKIKWREDNNESKKLFKHWKNGTTGYPIIDAGMRELNISGNMHNRIRMIVASFLVKDLHIDWRKGEKYFAKKLIDYDPIINNRNWCYIASITPESQPYFRVFNPIRQQIKFDKNCIYILKWMKEDFVNKSIKEIHNGLINGIVNHDEEVKINLKIYKNL